jgi:hypothetical protein
VLPTVGRNLQGTGVIVRAVSTHLVLYDVECVVAMDRCGKGPEIRCALATNNEAHCFDERRLDIRTIIVAEDILIMLNTVISPDGRHGEQDNTSVSEEAKSSISVDREMQFAPQLLQI